MIEHQQEILDAPSNWVLATLHIHRSLLFQLAGCELLSPTAIGPVDGPIESRLYYCSRRFEYSADREAIKFTHAPEIGVQALAKLHQSRELPTASDAFTELFMTHPTFAHRVGAIVKYGQIPADRLPLVLEEAGMTVTAAHTSLERDQKAS